jgi:hypothetical protein
MLLQATLTGSQDAAVDTRPAHLAYLRVAFLTVR